MRKRNKNNGITIYKARLVTQGFSQRPDIDYKETYSPMVDVITLRFLISLTMYENLDMHLMDVVTTYLYGSLDNYIYMKVPEEYLRYWKHINQASETMFNKVTEIII